MGMKGLKKLGIVLLVLLGMGVLYQLVGMGINHLATQKQTHALQEILEREISDIEIISVYAETGNTSGTGNHVDCRSCITFSTKMPEAEIASRLAEYAVFGEDSWLVYKTAEGAYTICLTKTAPFADNIEGH